MKCEVCQAEDAAMAIHQLVGGQERELFVCAACARKSGTKPSNPLVELLFGAVFELRRDAATEPVCPKCGFTRAEYKKRSRLGCAHCYEAFAREIGPVIRDMHRGAEHIGKIPGRDRRATELARLELALQAAVQAQKFEDAAALRDRIRDLAETVPDPTRGNDAGS